MPPQSVLRAPLPSRVNTTSGAMDKFTAKSGGGGGGVAVKRTKTVLKSRTYMEGGYMKSVCEEVEVTDDEEEVRFFVFCGFFSSAVFCSSLSLVFFMLPRCLVFFFEFILFPFAYVPTPEAQTHECVCVPLLLFALPR